ncbi:MAG TPA: hypothetical protein ENJ52_05320 [Aliiroseovarius sp.]|nr:hypothetical protein [Aliiroseovarius sp.]
MAKDRKSGGTDGRAVALIIAGTGLFWIGATWAGGAFGWPNRTRALLDLIALAGFVFALVNVWRLWRARQTDEG